MLFQNPFYLIPIKILLYFQRPYLFNIYFAEWFLRTTTRANHIKKIYFYVFWRWKDVIQKKRIYELESIQQYNIGNRTLVLCFKSIQWLFRWNKMSTVEFDHVFSRQLRLLDFKDFEKRTFNLKKFVENGIY